MVRGEQFAAAAAVLHLVALYARARGREVVVLQWGHVFPDGDNNRDQMRIGDVRCRQLLFVLVKLTLETA